ncbi:coiled-coil domain-containing protein 94-like [Plakobranchus ocellatus]|uniref:Splicing factor YJU2 n=1 Tax=Plakobranchus ocellatus TaxID=259542 RepID=A0AAV3Y3W1_9GAST|nr:coiled-coil domain-containing protein 94-like [Plakobranchus ocellatus]
MSERKVLNKYYPPEFDPSKIPKLKQGKNRTFSIRIMAPFNMRCHTCGEYIYKGKKFNSRKENVDDEDYLGLRIFRFYIKCPRCVAEIAFKTDLANTDYTLEAGATRLFEAEKLAHQMAEKERKEKEEDELNPMKLLENRTKASRNEMEQLDQLEELRELNARNARVDHENMLKQHMAIAEEMLKQEEQEEDRLVQEILNQGTSKTTVKRIQDEDSDEEQSKDAKKARKEKIVSSKATDLLADQPCETTKKPEPWQKSVGSFSNKTSLAGLVRKRAPANTQNSGASTSASVTSAAAEAPQRGTVTSPSDQKAKESSTSTASSSTGLGLLGGYSDSSEGDESS